MRLLLILNCSPAPLDLMVHGLDLRPNLWGLSDLRPGPLMVLPKPTQPLDKLLPGSPELLHVGPHLRQLGTHPVDGKRLGLGLGRPLVEHPDLGVPLVPDLGGVGGGEAEVVLGGGELLLEGHVGGGEALVVEEEGLNLAVLRAQVLLEGGDGRVRVERQAAEVGVLEVRREGARRRPAEERRRRWLVQEVEDVGWDAAPSGHGER